MPVGAFGGWEAWDWIPRRIAGGGGGEGGDGGAGAALRAPLLRSEGDAVGAVGAPSRRLALSKFLALGGPIMGMRMATFVLWLLLHIFLGHLGIAQLSAGLLGFTVFRGTTVSVLVNLSTGLNTIGGQAYGAREYKLVGLVFQRCLAFSCLYSLAIAVLYSQSQWLFSHLDQVKELAMAAGQFLLRISPSTLLISPLYCLHKYWAAQKVTLPGLVAGAVSVFIAPCVFWVFIFRMGWGVNGGALALDVIIAFRLAILTIWSMAINSRKAKTEAEDLAWHGWSLQAFRQWGGLLKIGVYAMLMMSVRGWLFDYFVLIAGILPDAEEAVSIFGISLYLSGILQVVTRALSSGLSFAVAHELGAGDAIQAKYTLQVASLVMIAVGLLYNGVLAACSRFVGLAWTHDEGVVSKLPPVIWISCFANMGQAVVHIFSGALNGCRRQKEGSWVATLLYGLIGIPGPWLFALSMRWGVAGLWATKLIVVVLEMALLGALVAQLDWQQEVERAMEVVQRTKRGPQGNLPFARDGGPQTNLSISDDGESQTNLSMSRDGGSQTNLSISRDGGSQTNLSISYDGESQTNLSIGHDGINLSKGQAGGSEESE